MDIENPSTDHEDFLDAKAMWQQQYPGEPFDLDKEDTSRMFDIQCLWCGGTNVMDRYVSFEGRDRGFMRTCDLFFFFFGGKNEPNTTPLFLDLLPVPLISSSG